MMSTYDTDKIDDTVLALLRLTMFRDHELTRAWKQHAWEVLDRLHERGYISDPRNSNKSILMTPEGVERATRLFDELFLSSE